METNNEDRWVANRLAIIEPQWTPTLARGRELLNAKLARPRHSWTWIAATATAAVCIAMISLPSTRALAQELWYRFVLNRVDIVRLDLSKLPLHMQVTTNGLEQSVKNMDEAERKAGFRPYLPSPGVLQANPQISVMGPISIAQTIHIRDMESALVEMGASDAHVPTEWEGVQLRTEIGPVVTANYPDNVQVSESRPIEVSVPPGFELERFAQLAFRSVGVSLWEARAMAAKFSHQPAWLLDIPLGALVNVQEVDLRSGPTLLIEDLDEKGSVKRATVFRNTSERMYSVSSRDRELCIKVAKALP